MTSKNKTAIITGAATNIGAAIAKKLGKQQVNVVINYHNAEQEQAAAELAEEISQDSGTIAKIFQADVGDMNALKTLFEFAATNFGKIDILINNAFLPILKPFGEFTEDDFDRVFRVNVKAVFFACQLAYEQISDCGRIINMSSNSTALILPNYGLYDASKGAIEQITRILSKEAGNRKITVNAVSPGPIYTSAWDDRPEDLKNALYGLSAMHRFGSVEEVANIVAFLASDEASWITGQNIRVNGGAA